MQPINKDEPGARAGHDGRIASLDAIRGIAILLVLLHHYVTGPSKFAPGSLTERVVTLMSFGWAGVDLFFVLSGFLIGGIILRNGHESGFLLAFYRRRAARLLPLYLLILGLYAVLAPILFSIDPAAAAWLVWGDGPLPPSSYLLYLQNFFMAANGTWGGHWLSATWSLAVEEQFYLVAPLLLVLVPQRHLSATMIALIASAPIFRVVSFLTSGHLLASYVLLPARWDALCIGILGAYLVESARARAWLAANPHCIMRVLAGLAAALAALQAFGVFGRSELSFVSFGLTLVALFALSLILAALFVDNGLTRALSRCRPLIKLGIVSYGVYLIHQPMIGLVHLVFRQQAPRFLTGEDLGLVAIAVVLTLSAAALSWRYLEAPILTRSRAFGRDAPRQRDPTAPALIASGSRVPTTGL